MSAASNAVAAATVLKSALRKKPTGFLLAEPPSDETYDFIEVAVSGHKAIITNCNAASCALAFERFVPVNREVPASAPFTAPHDTTAEGGER